MGTLTLPGGAAPTYDFAKIFQKLNEIEIIWTPRGCARFAEILLNLYSVDFLTFTLQLPIQTSLSVVPERQVFVSSLESCQNFSKTSTPQRGTRDPPP